MGHFVLVFAQIWQVPTGKEDGQNPTWHWQQQLRNEKK
jgi:hypothetical protein